MENKSVSFVKREKKRKTKYYYSHHGNEYIKENLKSNEARKAKNVVIQNSVYCKTYVILFHSLPNIPLKTVMVYVLTLFSCL